MNFGTDELKTTLMVRVGHSISESYIDFKLQADTGRAGELYTL